MMCLPRATDSCPTFSGESTLPAYVHQANASLTVQPVRAGETREARYVTHITPAHLSTPLSFRHHSLQLEPSPEPPSATRAPPPPLPASHARPPSVTPPSFRSFTLAAHPLLIFH
ncbi:hypothetical protein BDW22DRAFT_177923 [Trametopsis cervina]|nr:hypothetical protein BDW22DRAFT_177923 [Trametopsis cervina]